MVMEFLAICAALIAFAAGPSLAAASPELQDHTGAKVAIGTGITAVNEGTITFTPSAGLIQFSCSDAHMGAAAKANTAATMGIDLESTSLEGDAAGGRCTTNLGSLSIQVEAEHLPWCLHSVKLGTWTIRGGGCASTAKAVRLSLHFYNSDGSLRASCVYERSSISGTHNTGTSPLVLVIGLEQTFVRVESSGIESGLCFEVFALSGKLKATTKSGIGLKIL